MNREKLKEVFNELGIGKNGFLSLDEFSRLCDYFGMDKMTTAELKQLYHNLDADSDGKVSNNEFLLGMFRKESLNDKTLKTPENQQLSESKNKESILASEPKKDESQGKSLMSDLLNDFMNQNQQHATRSDSSDWLNYLDPDRTGYVKGADVISFWEKIEIPDGKRILEMLHFDPNGQIQPSDLSHALERELQKPTNDLFHKVAWITLLHSTDKFWNDNLDLVEECQRMKEELEKTKKEAEDDLQALTQKKDMEIRLLQEANQKLREVSPKNAALSTSSIPALDSKEDLGDLKKIKELEKQLEKSMEESKKLKQRNFILESEVEKLKKDLETSDTEVSILSKENEQIMEELKKANYPNAQQSQMPSSASFDIDDNMTHEEIQKKVKAELNKMQRLASAERKEAEGTLLMEISDLEKKHEEQVEKMKADHEKEKADIISAHKKKIEDALAEKERELMTDFAMDKMRLSAPDSVMGLENKISGMEDIIRQKEYEIKKQQDEFSQMLEQLENMNSRRSLLVKDAVTQTENSSAPDKDRETSPVELLPPLNGKDSVSRKEDNLKSVEKDALVSLKDKEFSQLPLEIVGDVLEQKLKVSKDASTETDPLGVSMPDKEVLDVTASESESIERKDYVKQLKNALCDLKEAESKIKELSEEIEKQKIDFAKLEELKKDLDGMKISHENEMKNLLNKHENDVATLKKIHEDEIMNLQEEHNMIEDSTKQKLEDATKKIDDLTDELSKIDNVIEALEEKVNQCDKKIANQEDELASKDKELLKRKKDAEDKDGMISDLEKQLNELLAKKTEFKDPIEVENISKDPESEIQKIKDEYEFKIDQMKKDREKELESLMSMHQLAMVRNPNARRLTLPVGEMKGNEIQPKLSDMIKSFEAKISDSRRPESSPKKLNEIPIKRLEIQDGEPSELKVAEMKKHFEDEKRKLNQEHDDDLKKEQEAIKELQGKLNEMEIENKKLSQTINDYEERMEKIEIAEKKWMALEKKLRSHTASLSKETKQSAKDSESIEPSTNDNLKKSRRASDIIKEYETKLEDLRKQKEKEKMDQKESFEEGAKRMKDDFQMTMEQLNRDMENKLTRMKELDSFGLDRKANDVASNYEQKSSDLKLENDLEVSRLKGVIDVGEDESGRRYEDLMNDMKDKKGEEIAQLNDVIKNLRRDLSNMGQNSQLPLKDPGLEQLQKKQVEELTKENKKLREENLQLHANLDSKQHYDDTKTESFQKFLLHNADLNAEKDLMKDQLRRTLEQLSKVTDALTTLTSQHRDEKQARVSLKEKLIDPTRHRELANKISNLESDNQKLQDILEWNQSEAAKALISTREAYDKEVRDLSKEKNAAIDLTQKLRKALEEKDKVLLRMDERRVKSDHITKDLYLENAKLVKCLQQLEKHSLEANSKIQMLEQKCTVLGDLVRRLCPTAIG